MASDLNENEINHFQRMIALLSFGITEALRRDIISIEDSLGMLYTPGAMETFENLGLDQRVVELVHCGTEIEDFKSFENLDEYQLMEKMSATACEILKSLPEDDGQSGNWRQYLEFSKKESDGVNQAWRLLDWKSAMQVRISKFNPIYRDNRGVFQRDEWRNISDIGKKFEDGLFALKDYIDTEQKIVTFIKQMLQSIEIDHLTIPEASVNMMPSLPIKKLKGVNSDIQQKIFERSPCEELNKETMKVISRLDLYEEKVFQADQFDDILKLYLRQILNGPLESENETYIHCAYDYSVFMGSNNKPNSGGVKVPEGLFIEYWSTPYWRDYG